MKYPILLFALASMNTYSIEPMDNYYSQDILEAVHQARDVPHHYDYSNTYRYKRTTSQSIELNRLNLEELEKTYLTIDGEIPKDTSLLSNNKVVSLEQDVSLPKQPSLELNTGTSLPTNSTYQSQYGTHKSTNVMNQGTLTSTPRP